MYLKIGDTIANLDNVDLITKDYQEDNYEITITLSSGYFIKNTFQTKELADEIYNKIVDSLNVIYV